MPSAKLPPMDLREGDFSFDFRLFNSHALTYGETYLDRKQVFINLIQHESLSSIIDTIVHESIHVCLKREYDLNDDAEHEIIRRMMLADLWLV